MANWMGINKFFIRWRRATQKAGEIKADAEKRQKSSKFAVSSIILSVISCALTAGLFLFPLTQDNVVMFILFGVLFGVGLTICGVINYVNAIHHFVLQLSINKKWFTWVALVVLIGCMVGSVVLVITAFGMI